MAIDRSARTGTDAAAPTHQGLTYLRVVHEVISAGITQTQLGQAVGASVRTVQNWAAGTHPPSGRKASRLLDIRSIIDLLKDSYNDEGIEIWLHSRNGNLDLRRPIDLLTEGMIEEVLAEARRATGAM